MKKILITGKNSFVGTSLAAWLSRWPQLYRVDIVSLRENALREISFAAYDSVFHAAGIAGRTARESEREEYFKVNRDLTAQTAAKAKTEGAKQFVFMSSMTVYGDGVRGEEQIITRGSQPAPSDIYGESKLEAENVITKMESDNFSVAVIRAPVIYGVGSKGNFMKLLNASRFFPVFPNIKNERSMIYIDNFCEFSRGLIDGRCSGIFFPQDREYVSTSDSVFKYRHADGRRTLPLPVPAFAARLLMRSKVFSSVFRSSVYEKEISPDAPYQAVDFQTAIEFIARSAGNKKTE